MEGTVYRHVKSLQNLSFLQNIALKEDHFLAGSHFFFTSLVVLADANRSEQTSNTNTVWSHLLLFEEFSQLKSSQYESMQLGILYQGKCH